MRLSDAVMLGSTDPKLPFDPWQFDTCLIGCAVNVFHDKAATSAQALVEAETRWPWLERIFSVPAPVSLGSVKATGRDIVSSFAFLISDKKATLEQAVDWIRSVEPADPEVVAAETEVMRSELCEAVSH